MSRNMLLLVVAVACIQGMASVVIRLQACSDVPNNKCTLHEVRITPCRRPDLCVMKRGKSAEVSFDFTPDFNTSNLQSAVYSKTFGEVLPNMDFDACRHTSCPTSPGKRQTYSYSLNIPRYFAPDVYPISWWLWNADDSTQKCCFETTIDLE